MGGAGKARTRCVGSRALPLTARICWRHKRGAVTDGRWAGCVAGWQGCIPLLVGVAGQGLLKADERAEIGRRTQAFFEDLRSRLPHTPIVVVSRLAEGPDQLIASIALAAGCELACVLPLEPAVWRATFTTDAVRAEFDRLLAASVVLGLPGAAASAAEAVHAAASAGRYLARHVSLLLAVWDSADSQRSGSAADMVRAHTSGWIGPDDPTVCRLIVGGSAVGNAGFSTQAAIAACGWSEVEQFNAAVLAAVDRGTLSGRPEPFAAVSDSRVADVAAVYEAASVMAADTRRAQGRRKIVLQLIALLAAISFISFFKFKGQRWLLFAYLGLLGAVIAVRSRMRRRALHRRYLDYRCLHEGLRVLLFWRLAGVGAWTGAAAAAPWVGRPEPSLAWIGSAMTSLEFWMGRAPLPDGFDGCQFAARHWLGSTANGGDGAQIGYYRRAARRRRLIAARLDRIVTITLVIGVASGALVALLPAAWLGSAGPVLLVIMGLMPLASGTASAAVDAPAELEMARQFEGMAELFAGASRRLAATDSDEERRHILLEVGAAALAEQRVWHAVFGQRPPEGRIRA